jgi:hypothetical protein
MVNILMEIEHRICQGYTDTQIMEELGIKEGHFTTTKRRYSNNRLRSKQKRTEHVLAVEMQILKR